MTRARHLSEALDLSTVEEPSAPVELRCENGVMHGKLLYSGLLEIKCHHIKCTKGTDIVYHYYDPKTGALVRTNSFQDPAPKLKGRKR